MQYKFDSYLLYETRDDILKGRVRQYAKSGLLGFTADRVKWVMGTCYLYVEGNFYKNTYENF